MFLGMLPVDAVFSDLSSPVLLFEFDLIYEVILFLVSTRNCNPKVDTFCTFNMSANVAKSMSINSTSFKETIRSPTLKRCSL